MMRIMRYRMAVTVCGSICCDSLSLFVTYYIRFLIEYIQDSTAPVSKGIYLSFIFIICTFMSSLIRNYNIFQNYRNALIMRKLLISKIYTKVGTLSMKSLVSTNSGKLISLISADLLGIERGICMI